MAKSRNILVTGAGSGMGLETALLLASRGDSVWASVLTASEESHLRDEAERRGAVLHIVRFDVRHADEVSTGVATVLAQAGHLDALVQFVGIGLRGFFEDLDMSEIERVFQINLFGLMRVTQSVLPFMRQARSGRIILTSSIGGRMGSMSISGYASSKFAIEGWAECLRQELAPVGIWVTLLEPGLIKTPHFSINRNRAKRAIDPASPYYDWFQQHEKIVDDLLDRNRFTTADVAEKVWRILASEHPRLRYVIGTKASLILSLRRHIPGEWFENFYWSVVRRMVTRPKQPAQGFSGLEAGEKR